MKIEKLYAYICTEEDGDEGVPAVLLGHYYFPLIGADIARIESLHDQAQDVANKTGRPVRLALFSQMQIVGEITPTTAAAAV